MDTQVLRVAAWREQKRKAGYQPLTVWLKAEVKHLIEDLASQSRQEIAEVVSEAIRGVRRAAPQPGPPGVRRCRDGPAPRRRVRPGPR